MNIFTHQPRGSSGFGFLFIFILIIILIFILDQGYIAASQCLEEEDDFINCVLGTFSDEEEAAPAEGSVTATGVMSGEYEGETKSVTVVMNIPLAGGEVTGNFSGDCEGSLKGNFAGGNGGTISGKGNGSCAFVIPASGSFSGNVNTGTKTVTVQGKASAAGFSDEGSLTLTYQ